jgi:hypothetical protein
MNYYGAQFKMGLAFAVAKLSFADFEQPAKRLTLELKQELLFDFAATH